MATTNKNFKVKNGLDVNGPIGVGSSPSYGSTGQVLTSQGTGSAPTWTSVSSSGLTPSDYVAQGRLTGDTSVTANADLVIPFVDDFDPQNWWDASAKKFTPTIAGYYEVSFQVWWTAASTSSGQNNIQIRKNGSTVAISQQPLHTGDGTSQNATKLVYLNGSTDYIDFTAYTNNTTSQTLQWGGNSNGQGTFFSAALMTAGKGDKGDQGDPGTSGNSFETISANGTSVVADSSTDTLTITPGDGLSIAGNATSDTITFTPNVASGSANGIVTTGSQTFAGEKTFSNNMIASANITANSGYVSADTFRIDTTYAGGTSQAGEISWDQDEGTVMFQLGSGAVTHRIGQQLDIRVRNNTGSTIPEGAVVYINGSSGQEPTIALANAASEGASAQTIGVVTHQGGIADSASGYVCIAGIMRGVDVGSYTAGTPLWLSTTAGQFTDTKPTAPDNGVFVGWVVKAGTGGSILIAIQNGYEIDELHNVSITDIAAGEILQRSANNAVWINQTLAEANIANLAAATNTFTGNVNATTFNGNVSGTTVTANSLYATSNIIANTSASNATIKLNAGFTSTAAILEMGDASNTASTPGIIFHSGTTGTNTYDSAISASGGNTSTGNGNLSIHANVIFIGNTSSNASTVNVAGDLNVSGTITGSLTGTASTATSATQVNTVLNNTPNTTFYPTFVADNNGTGTPESVYTSAGLSFDSFNNALSVTGNINANIITANNIAINVTSLATSGTINLNFDGAGYRTMANITGTRTFTASNYSAGETITVRIVNGSTTAARAINFPSGWVFLGVEPTQIAASKTGVLTVTSFGTTEADCVAAWAVQL